MNSPRIIVRDQQKLIDRNRVNYDIPTYEEGGSRGGNGDDSGFFIQDLNIVRHY